MKARILFVDDEPQLLFLMQEFLGRSGYEVMTAKSGSEALDMLIDDPPDLIVSDILMEGMDGFEFQTRVNSLTGSSLPFIFLSAKSEVEDRLQGLRGGADDYIVKPFDPQELEARISAVIERIRRTRQEERREIDDLKRRILTQVSSRLRTPVTTLMAHLNLLLSERVGEDERSRERYLESMLQDAQALSDLIDDLSEMALAASTGREQPIKRTPTRVAPMLRTAAAAAARIANEKDIDLEISCGGLLRGNIDGTAMSRVLSGLLKSATELSPRGEKVYIGARRTKEGGLEFVITDAGCPKDVAMESEFADVLRFARNIVQKHAGEISTRRDEDGRQSLVLWLPDRLEKQVNTRAM
ncbi:MAG: response regulator [Chloroflexota bacterium]|nr:response regulator [Chloroflexota bacterium]